MNFYLLGVNNMIEINRINEKTFSKFHKFTDGVYFDSDCLWLGATINDLPCGVLLARKDSDDIYNTYIIELLFVEESFRRQGIATLLLNEFIKICKNDHFKNIIFNSVTSRQNIEQFNLFLKNYGFKALKIVSKVYIFYDLDSVRKSPFIKKVLHSNLTPCNGIEILPLNEVPAQLLEKLKKQINIDYPDYYALYPVDHCKSLEQINTFVAIANKKDIVGWLTGLKISKFSIFYKSFFVKKEYQKYAIGIYLLNSCIKNQDKNYPNFSSVCVINLKNSTADKINDIYFKGVNKKVNYEVMLEEKL